MLTTDPNDPDLHKKKADGQNEKYLVMPDQVLYLSDDEKGKGFVRPLRRSYIHTKCGSKTDMGLKLCETYARDPKFYSHTYCVSCGNHPPVAEFTWSEDGMTVGS